MHVVCNLIHNHRPELLLPVVLLSPPPGPTLPPSPVSFSTTTTWIGFFRTSILINYCVIPILPVTTAASEVSSILEGRISGASTGGELEETGRVLSEYRQVPFSKRVSRWKNKSLTTTLLSIYSHRRWYRPCLRFEERPG
jgi:hypothetical protein